VARVPYAEQSDDPRVQAVVEKLPIKLNVFSMLANAPSVAGPALRLGEAILTKSELDNRLRELVILHVAQVTRTDYEWVQHVPIAQSVGVTDEQIEALRSGGLDGGAFGESELAALRLVETCLVEEVPAAELVEAAHRELGTEQLIELLVTAGYYAMLGQVFRAVQIDVDEPAAGGLVS
jgi:4-carboxymuconolactone decarboxylase